MSIEGVHRYNEIINNIITGDFYRSGGIVLPYRSGNTIIRLESDYPNTEFGLYINDSFSGTVKSDLQGNIVFSNHFSIGEVEIKLINHIDGRKILSWITIRDYAIWLASYAEALEFIDDNIQEAQDDLSIETVTINGIEDHFGKAINTYNNIGQDLDSYRNMIHELRLGYRNYGARFRGLETAVAAFTQVSPFGYSRRNWGPNWVLNQSFSSNYLFKNRSHSIDFSGAGISGVQLVSAEADCDSSYAYTLSYDATNKEFTWTATGYSGTATKAAEGELFIPGPYFYWSGAHILGLAGPFVISAGVSDRLYFNAEDLGSIEISLTAGVAVPVATIITDINTALAADPRYNTFAYVTFAKLYNSKLCLSSFFPQQSSIVVEHGPRNAAPTLFGVQPRDLIYNREVASGIYIKNIVGSPDISGNSEIEYEYNGSVTPVTRRLRWRSNGAGWSAWSVIVDPGDYTLTDGAGVVITVGCLPDIMDELVGPWPAYTIPPYSFSIGYNKTSISNSQCMGVNIICDTSVLPLVNTSDTVIITDDQSSGFCESPDGWWIENVVAALQGILVKSCLGNSDMNDSFGPSPSFLWAIGDLSFSEVSLEVRSHVQNWPMPRPGPRGCNYPQRSPGGLYDYEGFKAKFSGWFSSLGAGVATVTLGFSFDDGVTWIDGVPTSIVEDTDALSFGGLGFEDYTYVEFESVIPPYLTDNGVLVRAVFDKAAASMIMCMDSVNVEVGLISSGYLGNVTIPRTRHRQNFGELVWIWSPAQLTLTEKEYLGIRHKRPSMVSPLSGVNITFISTDTPSGVGTIEYEYNRVGDTRRIRWKSYLSAYGAWVPMTSDGSYTLLSVDGSYITVYISYSILLILSGSPPAVTTTRDINITDETVNQGHPRRIAAANSSVDILDVTEYDSYGNPINLFGAISEADFSLCGLINSDIKSADPFKESYIVPEFLPQEGEILTFTPSGPNWVATLNYYSDQDQSEAMLFENDILVPNDLWFFSDLDEITLTSFTSSAIYTISYGLLYQVTTTILDLSVVTISDYILFADYMLWDRLDKVQGEYNNTTPVYFNPSTGRAALINQSDMNLSSSILTMQDGVSTTIVAQRYWRFIDSKTIELDLSQLMPNTQYLFEYMEKRVYPTSRLTVVFEHRSGINLIACEAASWDVLERNENVRNDHDFHQLRLSVTGIRDLRDFKIRSLVIKGLHAFGTNAWIPALTEPA